jgi:hypothetical protein
VPVLALVRLERGYGELPPGTFLLRRQGADLELAKDGAAPPALGLPVDLPSGRPVILALAGPDGVQPPAALALFDTGSTRPVRLPGMAVLHPPGTQRWSLPAQGLADLLGRGLPRGNAAGWSIVALDGASLARAAALAPHLARLVPPAGPPLPGASPLHLAVWVDPKPALELVGRVRGFLEKVPLVERRQVRRWRDWETVLTPLARCQRISLIATGAPPDAFALVLHGCGGRQSTD